VTGTRARGVHGQRGAGQRPSSAWKSPATGGGPVFTDPSGRRRRRMRQAGVGASAALLACLVVMAAGLLGGPGASVIPWSGGNTGAFPGVGSGAAGKARPSPADPPARLPGPSSPASSSSPGAAASAPGPSRSAHSPAPVVTNRGGKAPPGLNRSARPKHTHAA